MGFKTKEFPYQLKVGRDINSVNNLAQLLKDQQDYFDFIMIDICHQLNFRTEETIQSRDIALTRSGTTFIYIPNIV